MITTTVPGMVLYVDGKTLAQPIRVELAYDAENDPLVVTATFHTGADDPKVWTVGRELMMRGATSRTTYGDGDVRFRFEGQILNRLMICLRSDGGHADVGLRQTEVVAFLNRTQKACALGDEPVEAILDRELADLFKEGDQA
jgi:hypothetical protein